jgi:hypothetical protein
VAQSGPDARETYRFPVRRRCVNRREGLAGYRKRSRGSAGIIATRGSGAFAFVLPEARVEWARTCLPGPSPNRPGGTLRGDGTASLDDKDSSTRQLHESELLFRGLRAEQIASTKSCRFR